MNVQVSGFLKDSSEGAGALPLHTEPLLSLSGGSVCSLPLSPPRLSSQRTALFLFALSCPPWFPAALRYLQIGGAAGYFCDKVSKYPGDE